MAEKIIPVSETTIYLREISNIQSSLSNVLINVQKIVEKLPDSKDHQSLLKQIEEISDIVDEISEKIKLQNLDIELNKKKFEDILLKITKSIEELNILANSDIYQKHINQTHENNEILSENKIFLFSTLQANNLLISDINNTLRDLEIKYNKPTIDDIQNVFDMAKRSKERFDYWNPKRKNLLWAGGILFFIFSNLDKIKILFLYFLKLFGG